VGVRRILLVPLVLPLLSCGSDDGASTLRVFAAASLTDAFADIERAFEAAHDGVDVVLNLAGSSSLREQIADGAPADVFASASTRHVEGIGTDPVAFATNELALAVPASNPGDVGGLDDLARDDLLVGLCAPEVPCGELARRALAEAGVAAAVDTEEPDVRALLTKLAAGELDAGLVYRTDLLAAGDDVVGADLGMDAPVTSYPVVAVSGEPLAGEFVDFLLGAEAQAILADHGFGPP
jgi:molybdate transport system substrate-binding protein